MVGWDVYNALVVISLWPPLHVHASTTSYANLHKFMLITQIYAKWGGAGWNYFLSPGQILMLTTPEVPCLKLLASWKSLSLQSPNELWPTLRLNQASLAATSWTFHNGEQTGKKTQLGTVLVSQAGPGVLANDCWLSNLTSCKEEYWKFTIPIFFSRCMHMQCTPGFQFFHGEHGYAKLASLASGAHERQEWKECPTQNKSLLPDQSLSRPTQFLTLVWLTVGQGSIFR